MAKKLQLVDSEGQVVKRDGKAVVVEVLDETQEAAFIKQGFKPIEK